MASEAPEIDYSLFPRPLSLHRCRPRSPEMKYENMDWVPEEYPELPAHQQVFAETANPYTCIPVTQQTIICGDSVKSTTAVEVVDTISGFADPGRAVYEVIYNETRCIAKCWAPGLFYQYAIEATVYEKLEAQKDEGLETPGCFAACYFAGHIMCSSLFPQGYIIILEMRPGVPVTLFLEDLSLEEQLDLIYRTRYGIAYLQNCGFEVKSPRLLEDILFCRETRRTTLIDFVAMVDPRDWDFLESQSNSEGSEDEGSWGSDETLVP